MTIFEYAEMRAVQNDLPVWIFPTAASFILKFAEKGNKYPFFPCALVMPTGDGNSFTVHFL